MIEDNEEFWNIGLDLKLKFSNKEASKEDAIKYAKQCIFCFEKYIYENEADKKPSPNNKIYTAFTYSADAYEFLGFPEKAKEYRDFSKQYKLKRHFSKKNIFEFNTSVKKRIFVIDDFYKNPDEIRKFALKDVEYQGDIRYYKGLRSTQAYRPPGIKEVFENIIQEKITEFDSHAFNGCFQICQSKDIQVYHCDSQRWAAMVYLTPNAPLESGTRLHRSKINGCRHGSEHNINEAFCEDFYDSTKFDTIDVVGNVYNRLVIMDAKCIHSAGPYFGSTNDTSRLTHLFFFD